MVPSRSIDVLRRDIAEDTYCQLQDMVRRICWKFVHKYGGEFEDWMSDAGELFMDALQTYNGKASITTWVWHRIHWGFYSSLRRWMRDIQRTMSLEDLADEEREGVEGMLEAPVRHTIADSIVFLSDSSRELWAMLNDPPDELADELDPDNPDVTWDAIQRHCVYQLRWTYQEIRTAINELKELCEE